MKTNCENVQGQLSAYIDNELSLAERSVIGEHLSVCPRCQREWEELTALAAGVTALPRLEPPPQFLADVHRKIDRGEKPREKSWQDYLFRPYWLKVPLEAVAAIVIAALVMRLERPADEPRGQYAASRDLGERGTSTFEDSPSPSMSQPMSRKPVVTTVAESAQAPAGSAPVALALSAPPAESPRGEPAPVVVVHASDFNEVRNRIQQIVISMNGRFVTPPDRDAAARTVLVELPETDVALFKSRLLEATGATKAEESSRVAVDAGAAAGMTPLSTTTTGIGPTVLTGNAGSNLIAVGGSERLHAASESKAPTVILEIRVVPPTN